MPECQRQAMNRAESSRRPEIQNQTTRLLVEFERRYRACSGRVQAVDRYRAIQRRDWTCRPASEIRDAYSGQQVPTTRGRSMKRCRACFVAGLGRPRRAGSTPGSCRSPHLSACTFCRWLARRSPKPTVASAEPNPKRSGTAMASQRRFCRRSPENCCGGPPSRPIWRSRFVALRR